MNTSIFWFRQDLRLTDNPGLYYAAKENANILPIYILDDTLTWSPGGAQRWWLHYSLQALSLQATKLGLKLALMRGDPNKILLNLCKDQKITSIYWNRRYEPDAVKQDLQIQKQLTNQGITVKTYKANLLYDPEEIINKQGYYFKIFTPFWKSFCLHPLDLKILPIPTLKQKILLAGEKLEQWRLLPSKPDWSSGLNACWHPGELSAQKLLRLFVSEKLENYSAQRDFPAYNITSRLSPHLHFGEISPKQIFITLKQIENQNPKLSNECAHFLKELGWREFSYHLLYNFPDLPEKNFRKEFDTMPWSTNKSLLACWQKGQTGFPIIDAGMRELWHTGYMHNRVRMIVASFLTKHLLIDWRNGAKWFWDTLVDADLANNSMNWQWVAGSGTDAAPYFRIFNPILQSRKFDPQGEYIRRWVPELAKLSSQYIHQPWEAPQKALLAAKLSLGKDYPNPIIALDIARKKALESYQKLKIKR